MYGASMGTLSVEIADVGSSILLMSARPLCNLSRVLDLADVIRGPGGLVALSAVHVLPTTLEVLRFVRTGCGAQA